MIHLFAILLVTTVGALAQYQKMDAPVNADGRTLSFHIFHFDSTKNKIQVHLKPPTLSKPLNPQLHLAAVALGAGTNAQAFTLETNKGALKISKSNSSVKIGPQLLRGQSPLPLLDTHKYARRNFLLHDGANHWALGYSPSMSQSQLAIALSHISVNGPIRYTSAYQLNAGSHSSLWVNRGSYHPLYLKELQPPFAVLSVK